MVFFVKAYVVEGAFGRKNIRLVERASAALGADQVRVAIKAASLNYRDLMMVEGQYNPRQPLPFVPLSDGVGVVAECGSDVKSLEPGQRVCPLLAPGWHAGALDRHVLPRTLGGPADGVLRSEFVAKAADLITVPEHLSDAQAATLPCAALTAWNALITQGSVGPGDQVLVLGTGGVALFALQFAKLAGARVIVTSSSDEKLERARQLGADATINYKREENWGRAVRKLSGEGVDHVVEVGGVGTLEQSLKAVRSNGTVSLIGVLAGAARPVNLTPVLMNNIRVQGVFVGHRESFEQMNKAIAAHGLVPQVDEVFAFGEVVAALDRMEQGAHFGKIVLQNSEHGV